MSWKALALIGALAVGVAYATAASAEGTKPADGSASLEVTSITITNGKIGPGANQTPGKSQSADTTGGTTQTGSGTGQSTSSAQVTVALAASDTSAAKAVASIAKAAASKKSTKPALSAECQVCGTINSTADGTTPITLALFGNSITPELLDSITLCDKNGPISVRCDPPKDKTTAKTSVTLTYFGTKALDKWDGCTIHYAFATTPWTVAKYEFWPKHPDDFVTRFAYYLTNPLDALGRLFCWPPSGLELYQGRAWLAFSFSPPKPPPTTPKPPAPPAGAAAPAPGAEVSASLKASNFKTLFGFGAIYATGNSAAVAKPAAKSKAKPASKQAAKSTPPVKPNSSNVCVTLFDKDTKFLAHGGIQNGGNFMREIGAGTWTVELAKYRVVHLPPSCDWPELGLLRKSLPATEDYLIVNSRKNQALPGAPIEIYADSPTCGTPKFAGKIGRLAKNKGAVESPIRIDQFPVVAPFARLARVRSLLSPVQAKIRVEDCWKTSPSTQGTFPSSRLNTVSFEIGGGEPGILPDTDDGPRENTLFLPSAALPNAKPECGFLFAPATSATCKITRTIEKESIDDRFDENLRSTSLRLHEASERIACLQDDLQRLRERRAAIQESTGVGQAESSEIQLEIRKTLDRLGIAEQQHAAAEIRMSRIVAESEKDARRSGTSGPKAY